MANVKFEDNQMIVDISGLDKVWGFKGDFKIPIDHVSDLTVESRYQMQKDGKWGLVNLRAPGLGLPTKKVGTFYGSFYGEASQMNQSKKSKKSYLDVSSKDNILFVTLNNEKYDYLFLSVANPAELMSQFQRLKGNQ